MSVHGWRRLACLLSHLLNPAGLALAVFGGLVWGHPQAWAAGAVAVVLYSLVPGVALLGLHRSGRIPALYPEERQERAGMLLAGATCYFAGVAALRWCGAPLPMLLAGATFGVNALLVWLINRHWKISIHAVGVGGGVCLLLLAGGLSRWPVLAAIPLVAWARLHLQAHTPAQVAAGLALGSLSAALLHALFPGTVP